MAVSYIEAFTKASQKPGSSKSISSVSTSSTLPRHSLRENYSQLEETSTGEFDFIQVSPDDFTVCHDVPIASSDSDYQDESHLPKGPVNAQERDPAPLQKAATFHVSSSPEKFPAHRCHGFSVKNGFIHCIGDEVEPPEKALEWSSCPSIIITGEFHTIYPLMEEAHVRGDCRPCAYFLIKQDGCRAEGNCNFCHLCPVGAIKKKKKEKVKALKERDRLIKERSIAAS